MKKFDSINKGYDSVFQSGKLSLGVVVPIENYSQSTVPSMIDHVKRVQLVECLGFKSIWIRDVPLHVPSFGDAGQTYDPFTYLGFLSGQTSTIGLGIGSIALPLHHPLHVAKSAATIDQLSDGRLIMGVASGDRPVEYPSMNIDFEKRGEMFRDAFDYIRLAQEDFPTIDSKHYGKLTGQMDVLPKPKSKKIPMLITGFSQQNLEWNAEHGDGWIYYPRPTLQQAHRLTEWRSMIKEFCSYDKPFSQPLYVILEEDDDFKPQPIQLGFRIGVNYLIEYFNDIQKIGVNHVAINLRFNSRNIEATLEELAVKVLPHFHIKTKEKNIQ